MLRKALRAITIFCSLTLAACGPSLTPTVQPTPHVISVQATIALRPLHNVFNMCMEEHPDAGLVLVEQMAPSINLEESALGLRWGMHAAPPAFAAQLGQEELVIIAHPDAPADSIYLDDLQGMYDGSLSHWPESEERVDVQAWAYPVGEDVQQVFEAAILGGQLAAKRAVFLAPDAAAMRQAVSETPNSIGFLPRRWLDNSVKPLVIEGMDPATLQQPYVVLSNSEPTGPEKAFLLCVQEHINE